MNDPFEFKPPIDLSYITYEEATNFFSSEEGIQIIYEKERIQETLMPYHKFKEDFLENRIKSIVDKWFADREQIAREMNFQDSICSKFHVICGSNNHLSILMWSHYAENHTGIVIEFNTDEPPFSIIKRNGRFKTIEYKEDRPTYKHRFDPKHDCLSEFNLVIGTKYTQWFYENEVRAVLPVGDEITKTRVVKRLDEHYYLSIAPQSISSIIMGERISHANFEAIKGLLTQPRFQHVKLKKVHLSMEKFALEIDE